ncbi:hypothetical protein [Sulfobacillus harzensis]|uniref:Succinate dehydrogenase n=1 Tax=Sulfobacillus harzensis TaxID=2729629 RepID=A0A7Y0L385_9FIRM|nr:hypothetical protein [Sulfobacillus harzensis]NMP22497.1 hypothetical protein [Sulfobacillus harzensis]
MAQPLESSSATRPQGSAKKEKPYWVEPLITMVVLGVWVLYSLWEIFFHNSGTYQNYISPYFSPGVGKWFGWHLLDGLYVAWVPFLFRFSCYYYRREYYRGFFWDPPGCAVHDKPRPRYSGETKWPLAFNNLHRYAWYLAFIVLVFLWKDAVQAFFFKNGFGVGIGSLLLLINAVLLTFYTFSCHAFRHMVGGKKDCFSCDGKPTTSYKLWNRVSSWNVFHGTWAWASLASVWAADLYIRLLSMGVIHDVRLF